MSDYGEVQTKTWKRTKRITINNNLGEGINSVYETEIATRDSETDILISKNDGRQFTVNHNLEDSFPLRNPLTGEQLGASMTKQELMVALFSCGWHDMEVNGI